MKMIKKIVLCCITSFLYTSSFAQMQDALMLTVSIGDNSDQTAIRFLEDATDTFDSEWDAYKFQNPSTTPNLYTVSDKKYSINSLNNQFEEKNLALYFKSAISGNYNLNADEIGAFDSTWSITLTDKSLNTQLDLRKQTDYTFYSQPSDPADRFLLAFKIEQTAVVTATDQTTTVETEAMIYSDQENIMINLDGISGVVFITDLTGREILNKEIIADAGSPWSFHPGKQGLYIVNLLRANKRYSRKIYLG